MCTTLHSKSLIDKCPVSVMDEIVNVVTIIISLVNMVNEVSKNIKHFKLSIIVSMVSR